MKRPIGADFQDCHSNWRPDFAILTERTQFRVYPCLQTGRANRSTAILTERTQFRVYPCLQTGRANRSTAVLTERTQFQVCPRLETGTATGQLPL